MSADKISWPHAPEHRLSVRGTYFVTASTYLRQHHFVGKARLAVLHRGLLKVAVDFGWQLEAWAVFSNHYHFVGHSPADEETAENLSRMLGLLHEKTAKWINRLDSAPARKIERADSIEHNQSIPDVIREKIIRADIVIADTTQHNPNVFYEVGLAHGVQKETILICRNAGEIPFDIAAINHVVYSSIVELRERLRARLIATLNL